MTTVKNQPTPLLDNATLTRDLNAVIAKKAWEPVSTSYDLTYQVKKKLWGFWPSTDTYRLTPEAAVKRAAEGNYVRITEHRGAPGVGNLFKKFTTSTIVDHPTAMRSFISSERGSAPVEKVDLVAQLFDLIESVSPGHQEMFTIVDEGGTRRGANIAAQYLLAGSPITIRTREYEDVVHSDGCQEWGYENTNEEVIRHPAELLGLFKRDSDLRAALKDFPLTAAQIQKRLAA